MLFMYWLWMEYHRRSEVKVDNAGGSRPDSIDFQGLGRRQGLQLALSTTRAPQGRYPRSGDAAFQDSVNV